jgi:hypothetical protein
MLFFASYFTLSQSVQLLAALCFIIANVFVHSPADNVS